MGRPRKHDRAEILGRLFRHMENGQSLRSFARLVKIDESDLRKWCAEEPFAPQYARAREAQVHALAEGILDIVDDPELTPEEKRVRIDARKWYTSKIAPKSYGERVTTEHTGEVKHEHKGTLTWGGVTIPL